MYQPAGAPGSPGGTSSDRSSCSPSDIRSVAMPSDGTLRKIGREAGKICGAAVAGSVSGATAVTAGDGLAGGAAGRTETSAADCPAHPLRRATAIAAEATTLLRRFRSELVIVPRIPTSSVSEFRYAWAPRRRTAKVPPATAARTKPAPSARAPVLSVVSCATPVAAPPTGICATCGVCVTTPGAGAGTGAGAGVPTAGIRFGL